ncbi:sulfotransferase domain-containing protein [cf. Phormidesmis sp. LEGE 11477]|uniref:sulfotransferase domain-containing protein n=1 Tax=cf. Phormidesmis sp. LEGE 11477 TaxID=1828680 RepID=UPI001880A5B4|nr:sulfotransferase domain-containing protein [cf. Phormidesmis sp. LEGE 11477]MBE9060069.1 sulfotransferase domain-containing protein [cf. Phormidesmis sp. LEGE 11477]
MLQKALFTVHPPTYRLFDRARQKLRPQFESAAQKHLRERQSADYLLISLTNCGRTWLRIILGQAIALHYHLPEVNIHDLFRLSEADPRLPAIKPMHEKYDQFGHGYTRQKVILLVRDPRDALVSRYHQHKKQLGFDSLERYIAESTELADYIQFYNDWQLDQAAAGRLVIRYEDMKADTLSEISRVFAFLDLPMATDAMEQAIAQASFQNMRKMELKGGEAVGIGVMAKRDVNRPNSFKVRKGSVGGYRTELPGALVAMMDEAVSTKLNPVYGYQ